MKGVELLLQNLLVDKPCSIYNDNPADIPFNPQFQKLELECTINLFRDAQKTYMYDKLTSEEKHLFDRQIEVMEELWNILLNRVACSKQR